MSFLTVCRWCCCCFLSVVNFMFALSGILLMASGGVMLWAYYLVRQIFDQYLTTVENRFEQSGMETTVDMESLHSGVETLLASVAVTFILMGLLLLVLGCLGCCGACFAVPCCLITYAVIIGIWLLAQIALVIIWFSASHLIFNCAKSTLETKVQGYRGTQNQDITTMQMDIVQMSFGCCGVNSGEDYYTMGSNWNRTVGIINKKENKTVYYNASYPFSCCKFDMENKPLAKECIYSNVSTEYSNFNVGCFDKIQTAVNEYMQFDRLFYSVAYETGHKLLLILGVLIIYYHKRQEQTQDIPHGNVQYKMQAQMA